MIEKSQKARVALMIYSLLGVVGIGTCFIIDFVHNEGITWALYVLYAVPFLFLGMLPLCFRFKHNLILSFAVLSVLTIPFLYLLDTIVETSNWFLPLALPITWKFLSGIWVCGIVLWLVKANKLYLSSALVSIFGTVMAITTIRSINQYRGENLSPLFMMISLLSLAATSAVLIITGYVLKLLKSRKALTEKKIGAE